MKVAIITGCNAGIGFGTAKILSKQNYEIVMACRNETKAFEAIKKIKKDNPDAELTFMKLDLSSMSSIHKFAEAFQTTGKPLHVLVNNAGFSYDFKDKTVHRTEDGLEATVGTNHFGHYLLTKLLLPKLKETASKTQEARIVVLASMGHDVEAMRRFSFNLFPTDFADLNYEKNPETYTGGQAYKNSKLCNVMFTYELARQLEGTGVTVNCLCPGFIPTTKFFRNSSILRRMAVSFLKIVSPSSTRTLKEGAGDVAMLASSQEITGKTGKYYSNGVEAESSAESRNEENIKKLWELSEKLVQEPVGSTYTDVVENGGLL